MGYANDALKIPLLQCQFNVVEFYGMLIDVYVNDVIHYFCIKFSENTAKGILINHDSNIFICFSVMQIYKIFTCKAMVGSK
jgi:hypothetical protein